MSYNFENETPIYLQIIEHIKSKIISGYFKPKDKIPSVRELSIEMDVNPNTVQKALVELEQFGLIKTERTNGRFVTDNKKLIEKIKNETVKEKVKDFCLTMEKLGIGKKEIIEMLKERK